MMTRPTALVSLGLASIVAASGADRLGVALGNARSVPTWNADAEFRAMRDASRKGQ